MGIEHFRRKYGSRIILILILVAVMAFSAMTAGAAPQEGAGDGIDGKGTQMPANAKARSFIVLMELSPAAVYEGDIEGIEATKAKSGEKFDAGTDAAETYAAYSLALQDRVLAEAGVAKSAVTNRYTTALNGFSAIMTEAQAEAVARQPGVAKVMNDQWRQPMTDASPSFLGLDNPGGAWDTGYTGEGVYVGVIDSGIWPEHPSFADDGSYAPHDLMLENSPDNPSCNFGNVAHNPNDVAFSCNNKLVAARQMLSTYRALIGAEDFEYDSARDENGHGTHTASTAAGNMDVAASIYGIDRGMVSGIAPRAYVLAYKGLGFLGGFTSDLASAIDQAVADGVDVINYSIGGGAGAPGLDEMAFLFADTAGVHVATSAGNSGPAPATLGNPGTMPWMTTVGASTQSRFFQGNIVLGNGDTYYGASITPGLTEKLLVDAAVAGGDLCIPGTLDPALVTDKIVLCRRGAIGRAEKSEAVSDAGGAGMIMYENTDDNNLFSDTHWVPSVHIDNTPGLEIKAYIAGQPFANNIYAPVIRGGNGSNAPGNAPLEAATAELVGEQVTTWNSAPSMTYFSSRGPNPVSPDLIKPDVTAPGLQILAGNTPTPDSGVPGELFQAIAGTSMSSPHVAGLFALIDQAHPDWAPAMAKSALMTTAYQDVVDNDRVSPADPFDMGAGHVDPSSVDAGSPFDPGVVYDAGLFEYAAYTCGEGFEVFSSGDCDFLEGEGVPSEAYNLNVPSIGVAELAGSQTVLRFLTNVTEDPIEVTASVVAPEGYSVTVNPSNLTIDSLDRVPFEVTITNNSAPVGEWRFGSLTWSNDMYEATSPIAVKGSLLGGAPVQVDGAGASGNGSFDISFGYDGSYVAGAHGLVPATVTSDNVVQDPDQEFDPDDGFSNKHDFVVTDAAFLRFAIPEDATEADADLDIFLFFNGEEIASSTRGGTDEQIDIYLPENGTYSLYVHGWSAPGGDSDYDMYSWIVPLATGGTLSVDAAPDKAELAATGTVEFSWTSAGGQWFLGAVSHAGAEGDADPGLLALTLVNVDNRP
jgi:subtilisin family serine protease